MRFAFLVLGVLQNLYICKGMALAQPPQRGASQARAWEAVFDRKDGWTGGDCAGTVPLPGARTLWLFGDSWIGPVREGRHAEGSTMVNNAIAVHRISAKESAPRPGEVSFLWGPKGADGKPTAWVAPDAGAIGNGNDRKLRYWPTGGGVVTQQPDGRRVLFVFLMRIREKNDADDVWNFEGCGSAVVRVENPDDSPERWRMRQSTLTRLPAPMPKGAQRVAWGAAALVDDRHGAGKPRVFIYGVDSTDGLNKKLLIARSPAATVDQFDKWSFRTRDGWSNRTEDAAPVAENVMDEMSVHRVPNGTTAKYVMIYSKPILDDHIVARTAPTPLGPWSPPREIFRCPEPRTDKRLTAYSAKAHLELSNEGELLVTYCVNSTDFWHMASDASIYRPRFIRLPLSRVLRPPAAP